MLSTYDILPVFELGCSVHELICLNMEMFLAISVLFFHLSSFITVHSLAVDTNVLAVVTESPFDSSSPLAYI